MEIITLTDTTSTNEYLLQGDWSDRELTVVTQYQSAGRGMDANTWESQPGMNLLFSILIHPVWLPISRQYLMSMAEALALHETLSALVPDADSLTIKWPNDIYYKDGKLSGTRIDINLKGFALQDMVIGTGININQTHFVSDAPNPISLAQITGHEHDCMQILHSILDNFDKYRTFLRQGGAKAIVEKYHSHLYRRDGEYEYEDKYGRFMASLDHVADNGIMTLRKADGTLKEYEFKEVKYII